MDKETLELINTFIDKNAKPLYLLSTLRNLSLLEIKDLKNLDKINKTSKKYLVSLLVVTGLSVFAYIKMKNLLVFSRMSCLFICFIPISLLNINYSYILYKDRNRLSLMNKKYTERIFNFNRTLNVLDVNPDFMKIDDKYFYNNKMLKLKYYYVEDINVI